MMSRYEIRWTDTDGHSYRVTASTQVAAYALRDALVTSHIVIAERVIVVAASHRRA